MSQLAVWGSLLLAVGLAWLHPAGRRADVRAFRLLNGRLGGWWLDRLFRSLWILGTSWALLVLLPATLILSWPVGLQLGAGLLLSGAIERAIKLLVGRPRPLETLPDARLRQPRRPGDPSFPSGDATRALFIAGTLYLAFSPPLPLLAVIFGLAGAVTLGRVYLGAHWPTDALAGAGLGMLAALAWDAIWRWAVALA